MKRGVPYLEAVKEGMREGKTNAEARKLRKYNQKSGESTSVDLAPMVDIAFLLLTFFIMTTSFSKPKVFGMGLPQESSGSRGAAGKKAEKLTLKISKDGNVYITKGEDSKGAVVDKLEFPKIRQTIKELKDASEGVALVVKVSEKTDFGKVIDILDEVYGGGVTEWATLTLKPEEEKIIEEKEEKT